MTAHSTLNGPAMLPSRPRCLFPPRLHTASRGLAWLRACLLGAVAGLAALPPVVPAASAGELPVLRLRIGGHAVVAEVASTPRQRETGLMERRSLAPDHGMLFVFRHDQDVCMWMKDTYLPLSVAFIDAGGAIRNLADMRPLTLDTHCASGAVRYALEMPLGWFAGHQVAPGARVLGLPTGP